MPSFQFHIDKHLRNAGLEGKLAWAILHDGALQLQDDHNRVVRFALDDIARVRLGYVDGKYRSYHARIWRDALGKPATLTPTKETWPAYRDTMHELVRQLVERGRLDRVETGSTKFDAMLAPALMAIPTLGAWTLALFVLTNEPWWGRVIVPLVPTLIFVLLVWLGQRRHWPRPLGDVSELRVQLP